MKDSKFDQEALVFASEWYGIPLDEDGAEAHLRKSYFFAWKRADLAFRDLGNVLLTTVRESWLGRKLGM